MITAGFPSKAARDWRREKMKVLALDSSGLVASVAIVEENGADQNLLAEYTVNY